MILLRHAKRIAHDSGRGMALPGLYSGRFLFCRQHDSEIPIAIQRNRGGERGLDTAWMGAGCILRN